MEARIAVEAIEIRADELAVFHADAGIIDQSAACQPGERIGAHGPLSPISPHS